MTLARRRGTTRYRDPGPVAAMPPSMPLEPTLPPIEHVETTLSHLTAMEGQMDRAFRELDESRKLFSEHEFAERERAVLAAGQLKYELILKNAVATARRLEGELEWTERHHAPNDAERTRLLAEETAAMARVTPLVDAGHGLDDLVAHFVKLGDAAAARALAANGSALMLARGGRDGLGQPEVEAATAAFSDRAQRAAETFLPADLQEARATRRRLDAAADSIVVHRRLTEKALRGEHVTADEKIDVGLVEIGEALFARSGHSRPGIWAEQPEHAADAPEGLGIWGERAGVAAG